LRIAKVKQTTTNGIEQHLAGKIQKKIVLQCIGAARFQRISWHRQIQSWKTPAGVSSRITADASDDYGFREQIAEVLVKLRLRMIWCKINRMAEVYPGINIAVYASGTEDTGAVSEDDLRDSAKFNGGK
ncbi:MAG: hypothetical protein ACLR8P_07390, partial [Clostridium fessum]